MINLVPSLLIYDEAGEKIQEKVKENILQQLNLPKVPEIYGFLKIDEASQVATTKAFYKAAAKRAEALRKLDCWVNESVEVFIITVINKKNISSALTIAANILDNASQVMGGGCSLILLIAKDIFGLDDATVTDSVEFLKKQLEESNYFKKIYFVDEYNEMGLVLDSEEEVYEVTAAFISSYIASEMSLVLLDLTRSRFEQRSSQLFASFSCYNFKFSRKDFVGKVVALLARDFSNDLFQRPNSNGQGFKSKDVEAFTGHIKKSVEKFVEQYAQSDREVIFSEIINKRNLPPTLLEDLAEKIYACSTQLDFNLKMLRSFLESCLDDLLVCLENEQKKIKEEKEAFIYQSITGFSPANPAAVGQKTVNPAQQSSAGVFESKSDVTFLKDKFHLFNLKKELYFAYFVVLDIICLGFDSLLNHDFCAESKNEEEKNNVSKFSFDLVETPIIENFYALESVNLKSNLNSADIINRLIRNLFGFPKTKPQSTLLNYCLEKLKHVEEYPLEKIWKYSLLPMPLTEKLCILAPLNLTTNSNSERFLVINAPQHWYLDENSFEASYIKKTVDSVRTCEGTIIQLSLETPIKVND